MKAYRFVFAAALFSLAQPGEAFINFKKVAKVFRGSPEKKKKGNQTRQAGQELLTFKFKKAKAEDVQKPLESYMEGLGGTGFVTLMPQENALVITDFPQTLARLKILLPDIDQLYDHPEAGVRRMRVMQALLKSIRSHPMPALDGRPVRALPGAPDRVPLPGKPGVLPPLSPLLSAPPRQFVKETDELSRETWRRLEDTYSIRAFQVVGWVKDHAGYMVVLNNQGNRFLYRNGRVREGYKGTGRQLPGISGSIQNMRLTLVDIQGKVSLPMIKEDTR